MFDALNLFSYNLPILEFYLNFCLQRLVESCIQLGLSLCCTLVKGFEETIYRGNSFTAVDVKIKS